MEAERIVKEFKTIAVIGASANPERPSYRVANYMMQHGYNIIPVNPAVPEILGKKSYPDLASIPENVEVVDVFRNPAEVMPVVEQAIKIGAKALWLQEGVINEEAAKKAREAGLLVVMDQCIKKVHERLANDKR